MVLPQLLCPECGKVCLDGLAIRRHMLEEHSWTRELYGEHVRAVGLASLESDWAEIARDWPERWEALHA